MQPSRISPISIGRYSPLQTGCLTLCHRGFHIFRTKLVTSMSQVLAWTMRKCKGIHASTTSPFRTSTLQLSFPTRTIVSMQWWSSFPSNISSGQLKYFPKLIECFHAAENVSSPCPIDYFQPRQFMLFRYCHQRIGVNWFLLIWTRPMQLSILILSIDHHPTQIPFGWLLAESLNNAKLGWYHLILHKKENAQWR